MLQAIHSGNRNFIVQILPEGEGWEEQSISAVGEYRGTRAHHVVDGQPQKLDTGPHRIEVHADGDWEITLSQPQWEDAPPPPVVIRTGRGDAVIGPIYLDQGEVSVDLDYRGSRSFTAKLISVDGENFEQIASGTESFRISRAVRIQRNASEGLVPGVYVLDIHADGEWGATIEN